MTPLILRQAKLTEATMLSDLAIRSKSYWKYEHSFLEQCRPAMKIDEDYINEWPVVVAEKDQIIIGFYALKDIKGENRLDHLWIDLPYIRQGFGKILLLDSFQRAQQLGWKSFRLATDQGGEPFYLKHGARNIGTVQSRIRADLFLKHMEFIF